MFRERPVSPFFFLDFLLQILFSRFFFVHLFITLRGKEKSRALIGRNFNLVCESFFERDHYFYKKEKKMSETLRRMRHQSLSEGKVRHSSSSFIVLSIFNEPEALSLFGLWFLTLVPL